jgi:hypothetical protein
MSASLAAAVPHYCETGPITQATTAACAKVGVNIHVAHAGYAIGNGSGFLFIAVAAAILILILAIRRGLSRGRIAVATS